MASAARTVHALLDAILLDCIPVKLAGVLAFSVTIPEKVTLNGSNTSATVKADGVKVGFGKQVVVGLTGINVPADGSTDGDGTFTVALEDDANETLAYTVSASGNVSGTVIFNIAIVSPVSTGGTDPIEP